MGEGCFQSNPQFLVYLGKKMQLPFWVFFVDGIAYIQRKKEVKCVYKGRRKA